MPDKTMIFLLVFGLATGLMSTNVAKAQNIVEDGLVSYWSFDGGTAEDLFGDNDGTIEGGPGVVDGKIGDALEFDGVDDFVDMGDPADDSLDFGDEKDFSIAAWMDTTACRLEGCNMLSTFSRRNPSGRSSETTRKNSSIMFLSSFSDFLFSLRTQ